MMAAAMTFGKILQVGGPEFTKSILEMEVQRAVDLMTVEKTDWDRHAGILILNEIATHASEQFYRYVTTILEKIVIPLRDTRVCTQKASFIVLLNFFFVGIYSQSGSNPAIEMSCPCG